MPNLRKDHIEYLTKRGVKTELLENNYFSDLVLYNYISIVPSIEEQFGLLLERIKK